MMFMSSIPRYTWKILSLGILLTVSNYISFSMGKYTSFFSEYMKIHGGGTLALVPCGNQSTVAPSTFLRGGAVVGIGEEQDGGLIIPDFTHEDGVTNELGQLILGPLTNPKFTQPSPHLWENIPLVEPHTGHKKVLVTGAAGFIGSHVAHALLDRGDEVIVVDEMNDYYDVKVKKGNLQILRDKAKEMAQGMAPSSFTNAGDLLSIYKEDINNATLMNYIFETHQPKWICHLAARAGVRPSIVNPLLYVRANVHGTSSILELSRIHDVSNVVIASSSSVYGESDSTYFSEAEMVDEPVSPYASTKRAGEIMSYTYHKLYNLKISCLRFFTVYGPRGRPDMAPYKFVDRISRGESIPKFGDGSTSRDYTYVSDIVDGVLRSIDRPYPYEVFNLGKGSGTTLNEFIALVETNVGKQANITQMEAQLGDVPFTNADVSKAKRLLGYTSKVPMEEGIRRTVEWYKEAFGEKDHDKKEEEERKEEKAHREKKREKDNKEEDHRKVQR
eukprot:CAMPEP_0183727800 /NCGR_PEP_ID=MMETSP0737-20130205/26448_1 /TAXON_ID=385413 /ORGANISM="Thalassiosira miniscula, Strain CCMP1093" /LENGTH=501 /DNA_ID=CAMNT_0025959531 /DNA_START=292 /DNA_END=1797 /DNA_ORIENTATION=+